MADLTPNDLSHLSDEEFTALAPQGYHATGPAEPLSPAAQEVFWEFNHAASGKPYDWHYLPAIAAALRAAADQVVPEELKLPGMTPCDDKYSAREIKRVERMRLRAQFLAIADELDGTCMVKSKDILDIADVGQ